MPCGTNRKGIDTLKRLKQKILSMEANTKTYKAMYEGSIKLYPYNNIPPYEDFDNTYYREEVGYRIEQTHKLATDKPTITISIPVSYLGIVYLGEEAIDLRMLSGLITKAQRNAVGFLMRYLAVSANERRLNLPEKLDGLYKRMEKEGLDCIFSNFFTECERFMDLPRKEDVLAAVNRMRKVRFLGEKGGDSCSGYCK